MKTIDKCRVCGSTRLEPVLSLGDQALTGVFPRTRDQAIPSGPLELVKCSPPPINVPICGLVQLRHSYDPDAMYGKEYGYRSGLNGSMVDHLRRTARNLQTVLAPEAMSLRPGDVILDIGSNDGTLLSFFPKNCALIGIDPIADRFARHYPMNIIRVPDFFSKEIFLKASEGHKAKIVTSIAMFYDLEDPLAFARDVHSILADDGIWHFEQSYLPRMLAQGAYDTICHEHVEYYAMRQILWILNMAGFSVTHAEENDVNGGSVAITAKKDARLINPNLTGSTTPHHCPKAHELLAKEEHLDDPRTWKTFTDHVKGHRARLRFLLDRLKREGARILGMGASTKGNVLLQWCGIGPELLDGIVEVNEDKFGSFTPGTLIPILSEAEAAKLDPTHYLVLPWHFRSGIITRSKPLLEKGASLIFPLPRIEIVDRKDA